MFQAAAAAGVGVVLEVVADHALSGRRPVRLRVVVGRQRVRPRGGPGVGVDGTVRTRSGLAGLARRGIVGSPGTRGGAVYERPRFLVLLPRWAFVRGEKDLDALHVRPLLERRHRAVGEATVSDG